MNREFIKTVNTYEFDCIEALQQNDYNQLVSQKPNLNEFEQNEKLEKLRKQFRSTDNLLELDQEQFDFYDSNHNQITNVEQTPQNQKAPAKTLNRSKTYTSLKSSQFFLPNVTPVNDKRLIDKSSFANTCHLARELANINLQDDYSSKSAEMNIVKAKSKSKL